MLAAACAAPPAADRVALGDEVVALVRQHFFDRDAAARWADAHRGYAADTMSTPRFVARTRQLLAQLHASHTGYFTADDPEYHALAAIFAGPLHRDANATVVSIGVDVTADGFVRRAFAGGPAAAAGIRRGDRIVGVAGDDGGFAPVASLRRRAGAPLRLLVQRRDAAPPQPVTVVPRAIAPPQEWLEAQQHSARIVDADGARIAVMAMFSGAGEAPLQCLRQAIAGEFATADALVLDLRGGYGGCNADSVTLFDRTPAVIEQIDRDGVQHRFDGQWRRPLVLLIDATVRSGKEVVARSLQRHHRATVVGERSAGAVLGGTPFALQDGSLLYLAVADVLVDGERLEGRGVEPDVAVADRLPFAAGADPQLDRAIAIAADLARQ